MAKKINSDGSIIRSRSNTTSVYFVLDEDANAVKIGYATNPSIRIASLRTANIHPLIPLLLLKGGRELELELHKKFHADRITHEWFHYSDDIKQFIVEKKHDTLKVAEFVKNRTSFHLNKENSLLLEWIKNNTNGNPPLSMLNKSDLINSIIFLGLGEMIAMINGDKIMNRTKQES